MENPLVSIIIPVYNRAHLIEETLNSVYAQTYQNWECIIIDDHSTDNSVEKVKKYIEKDERFKLLIRPNNWKKGASSCRNYGLKFSRGVLIQFLDSDDLLKSNKLEEQIKFYKGDLTLLTCKWGGFNRETDLLSMFKHNYHSYRNYRKGRNLLKTFGKRNEFFPPNVYLVPKKLINQVGFWNDELTNNDDAEFFTRVILSAKKIRFTSKTAVYYRYSGSDKLSSVNSLKRMKSAVKSWNLIEKHLQMFGLENHAYVLNGKKNIQEIINNDFPDFVNKNPSFLASGD